MKKIGEVNPMNCMTMTVYYDDKVECNPYRVYQEWYAPRKRRIQIGRYADLGSCMWTITNCILENNEHGRG